MESPTAVFLARKSDSGLFLRYVIKSGGAEAHPVGADKGVRPAELRLRSCRGRMEWAPESAPLHVTRAGLSFREETPNVGLLTEAAIAASEFVNVDVE